MRLVGAWFKVWGLGFQVLSRASVMEGGKPGLIRFTAMQRRMFKSAQLSA